MSTADGWAARRHRDPYCTTHCHPGLKHSQCGCSCDHLAAALASPAPAATEVGEGER